MRLPARGFHQLHRGRPAGPLQQFQDCRGLAAVPAESPFFSDLRALGAFFAGVAFFPDLAFFGATFAPRLPVRAVLVAFGSAAVRAGAVSICSAFAIMLSPLALITADCKVIVSIRGQWRWCGDDALLHPAGDRR